MPIANDYKPKQVTGDGVTTVVTFNFKIYTAADLLIIKTDDVTLESETLTLGDDYTVIVNATTGGTVTFLTPLVADKIYTLASNIAQSQTLSVQQVGKFRNDQYISALDRLTRIVQDVVDAVKRSIKAPVNNPSFNGTLSGAVVSGRALVIDDAGTGIKISETDVGDLDSAISTVEGYRDAAAGYASNASTSASAAQTAKGLAEDARDEAIDAAASVPTMATILESLMPVGFVVTLGVSTNPATLYGFGTWSAIAGRVIVGLDGTQTEFDTLNETGGAKTHTLTVDEMPAHTHPYVRYSSNTAPSGGGDPLYWAGTTSQNTGSAGGGQAHNNLQPYIVKYIWERTA